MSTRFVINMRDPEFRRNPYPILARLRETDPVHQDDQGIWYVTRHADVVQLNKDPRLGRDLRKWLGYPLVRPYLADTPLERCVEQWMFSLDPPDHTRLRKLVVKAFTPRAVAAMRPAIEAAADELLDALAARGRPAGIDLVEVFARPFPVRVISAVLGLPLDGYDELRRWSDTVSHVVEPTSSRRQRVAANEAVIELMAYLRAWVERRRGSRSEDVISVLIDAEEEGDRLSEEELISQLVLLFIAGHETTANLIGNGMLALSRHPAEADRLRRDPSLYPSAVEEMLRYDGPANTNGRIAHADIEIGGKVIGTGQALLCMLGAANRDPLVFADPDRLDVGRAPNPHVTFGGGIHHCLGASLARLEAAVALERLFGRLAQFEAVEEGVVWRDVVNIRGLQSLPMRVEWTA